MKRYVLLLSLSLGSLVQMHAQSLEECRSEWNESSANVSDNIRYTSLNPSRISFNSYKNKGVAKLDYTIGRGTLILVTNVAFGTAPTCLSAT